MFLKFEFSCFKTQTDKILSVNTTLNEWDIGKTSNYKELVTNVYNLITVRFE